MKTKSNFLRVLGFFIFPAVVFLVSTFLGLAFNAYAVLPWLDIPMHFLGGLSIAYTVVLFLNFFREKNLARVKSFWVFVLVVVSVVSFIAVLWEFYEFFMKYFFDLPFQPSLEDTLLDLFLGLVGGFSGAVIFRRI